MRKIDTILIIVLINDHFFQSNQPQLAKLTEKVLLRKNAIFKEMGNLILSVHHGDNFLYVISCMRGLKNANFCIWCRLKKVEYDF